MFLIVLLIIITFGMIIYPDFANGQLPLENKREDISYAYNPIDEYIGVETSYELPFNPSTKDILKEVILKKLTVWKTRSNKRVYAKHCRDAYNGCELRIEAFSYMVDEYSEVYNVDLWLSAAIVWHESRYDPFAVSRVGAAGIYQLHPKSRWAKGIKFIHDKQYRYNCRKEVGNCQQPIVENALKLLNQCFEKCGSVKDGLGMYNTGKCGGNPSYARNIYMIRKQMLEMAN